MVLATSTWPVNELGEILAQSGVGSSTTSGQLPNDLVPLDGTTGKVIINLQQNAVATPVTSSSVTTYDTAGRVSVVTTTSATGITTVTYMYDSLGRVATSVYVAGATTKTTTYSYDSSGNFTGMVVS